MTYSQQFEKEERERLIEQAKIELSQALAVRVLLKNPTMPSTIKISGLKICTADNSNHLLLPVIERQIKEIRKCLKGKKNDWE